jgi:hypothetical protein
MIWLKDLFTALLIVFLVGAVCIGAEMALGRDAHIELVSSP